MADDGLTPCDTLPFVTTILTVRYKQVIVTTRAPSASINDRKLYLIVNYTNESKLQQFGTIFLLENGFKMSFVTILSRSQCVEIFTNCKPPLFSLSPLTESYQLFLHIPLRWRHNVSRLFTQSFILTQIKENIKAPRHWSLCGQFTGIGEFPEQRASYAESVSIWWRQHAMICQINRWMGDAFLIPDAWYYQHIITVEILRWWNHKNGSGLCLVP